MTSITRPRVASFFALLFAAWMGAGSVFAQPSGASVGRADPVGEPIVSGSVHRIASTVYGTEQILTVRLPRGYGDDAERTYPVLYSIDGGPEQDFDLLSGIAAEAEFSESFEPFILIGIQTEDRYSQLTPAWTRVGKGLLSDAFGDRIKPDGATKFRRYLAEDVMPWVGNRYRGDRTILTSASLGGLFVLDTLLERPEMFDDYIALTPSLWWDGGRIADEAAAKLAAHSASDRRLYFTMGDEGVGNKVGQWVDTLISAFEQKAPEGLKWAFVDRSDSEEHRTMALTGWLDAFRTLYLIPSRTGSPLPLIYEDFTAPKYTAEARENLDAGKCRREIAEPVRFAEKNAFPDNFYGLCVLMKPGHAITAGNFTPSDFGRPK